MNHPTIHAAKRVSYPAYKPSKVEWLDEVPGHWEVLEIRRVTTRVTDGAHISPDTTSPDYQFVSTVDIDNGEINFESCLHTSAESFLYMKRTGCCPSKGDVLFSKDGTIGRTAVVRSDFEFAVASSLVILSPNPKRLTSKFLNYWLNGSAVQERLGIFLAGTALRRISVEKVSRLLLLLPPLQEQHAIASFLDRETKRIDILISKKERQIELLHEKHSAIKTSTLTQGLNSHKRTRDSNVKWLGSVPQNWEITKLQRLSTSIQTGPFGSQLHASDYVDDGNPVINPANIQNGEILPDRTCSIDKATAERLARHRLNQGDIIFARRGEMGRCALVTRRSAGFLCGTGCLRITLNEDIATPTFVALYLGIPQICEFLSLESVGSTMDNLNTSILSRIPIPVPPIEEQRIITKYLAENLSNIDSLITHIRNSIEILREYRTAVITAAVTGQIDVRQEVAVCQASTQS